MQTVLYTAAWVCPVTAPVIRDGAVLVDGGGIIRHVGPAAAAPAGPDVETVHLGDAILLPGLVNVHTHPELTAMRGLLEDLPFNRWITTLKRTRERAGLSDEEFDAAARWACLESIEAGVTTCGATEDSGAALDAMRAAGMRGIVYREVFGPAPEQAPGALEGLQQKVADMRRRETDLVRVGVSPHAPYTVSDELFTAVADWARQEALPVAVHTAEADVEVQLVTAGAGRFADGLRARGIATPPRAATVIQLLERTGILATKPLLIHCVKLMDDDIRRLADSGASVAHCPTANARLGHGVAHVAEMLDAHVCVGIGTDSVASNNRIDLLEETRVAHLMQRARLHSGEVLPPATLLRLATLDGARALGVDSRVGSLAVGKDADLCAVRVDAPHAIPMVDPLATLFHSARGADVVLTVVRGRVLYRDGEHRTLSPHELRPAVDAIAARLVAARDAP